MGQTQGLDEIASGRKNTGKTSPLGTCLEQYHVILKWPLMSQQRGGSNPLVDPKQVSQHHTLKPNQRGSSSL